MLWNHYVFRQGLEVQEAWGQTLSGTGTRLLYVAGRGFDPRAPLPLRAFLENLRFIEADLHSAELLLVHFPHAVTAELELLAQGNASVMMERFSEFGTCRELRVGSADGGDDELSPANALRLATKDVLARLRGRTHVVLDVSSLPKVVAVALITAVLDRLIPNKGAEEALYAKGVTFEVVVAEDAKLDAAIHAEDPANELVLIPGFSSALRAEGMRDLPLAWFPILGENRGGQLTRILTEIPADAEICPVLPHPSSDPRRADGLLNEYRAPLFDSLDTPVSNILLVHERNPFEAYRQLLLAMERYRNSMSILGGCRLVVTPLGSKLITVGASCRNRWQASGSPFGARRRDSRK